MPLLLRLMLPDVPGSLGAVATALGEAGADIEAIEIIEHRSDGHAIDDVLVELPAPLMPDTLVSACQSVKGVQVVWVSRYNAGANLSMDLEVVEAMTGEPAKALDELIAAAPVTFRADWALALGRTDSGAEILAATSAAPMYAAHMTDWLEVERAGRLPDVAELRSTVMVAAPLPGRGVVLVLGRRGGPDILDSEIARFAHLTGLAASITASA